MPPLTPDTLYRLDPAYQQGYKEGFEAAQRRSEQFIKELLKSVREIKAFMSSTATISDY